MQTIREFAIIDFMKSRKYCTVNELRRHFGVSSATIHRDIAKLAARDVLRKMHGGVAFIETPARADKMSSPFLDRVEWNRAGKQAIAQKALERICEGDILYLDSSTTVGCLAERLIGSAFSNLTIVTNSVSVIQNFHRFPAHYVLIALGGSYDLQLNAFLGQAAIRELERLSIRKAFVSAFGVTEERVTTNHEYHSLLLTEVLEKAELSYLLVDKGKFKRNGLFKIATRRTFTEIISD
ncbi:MAG: DeoR/GlpR family DNA-binding transcription regulator [Victivallaceae bacterium]|nr:DeoR/GlpR family DNA-binding transcription regulator [Victivallaceae bacterium]